MTAERRCALRCFLALVLTLGPAILSASPVALSFRSPKIPRRANSDLIAQGLERRLLELGKQLRERNNDSDRAAYSLAITAAVLNNFAPEDPGLAKMMADLKRLLDDQKAASDPIILKMTLIARRLQRYRQTHDIFAKENETESLRDTIESPWASFMPLPKLELELNALIKQLQRHHTAPKTKTAPLIAAAPAAPASRLPVAAAAPTPGNPHPITALTELLYARNPRLRSLAADELRRYGPDAAAAAPALKTLLWDSDPRVRSSALSALGAIRNLTADVVTAMRLALDDKSDAVRGSAKAALENLGHLKLP